MMRSSACADSANTRLAIPIIPNQTPALPDLLNELRIEFLLLLSGRQSTRIEGTTSASQAKHMPASTQRTEAWYAEKNRVLQGEKTTAKKSSPKKAIAKKVIAKKAAPKKTAIRKTATKKRVIKRSVTKKAAPKKSAPKKTVKKTTKKRATKKASR